MSRQEKLFQKLVLLITQPTVFLLETLSTDLPISVSRWTQIRQPNTPKPTQEQPTTTQKQPKTEALQSQEESTGNRSSTASDATSGQAAGSTPEAAAVLLPLVVRWFWVFFCGVSWFLYWFGGVWLSDLTPS